MTPFRRHCVSETVGDRRPLVALGADAETLQPHQVSVGKLNNVREALAIARRMVAVDGGTLTLSNRAGGGLTAEIVMPHSNISLQMRCVAAKSEH